MRRLLIAALVFLFAYGLSGQVRASSWHTVGACPEQSYDQKTGPAQYWWKAVTVCHDHPASELYFIGYLQVFEWTSPYSGYWRDSIPDIFDASRLNSDYVAMSGFRPVQNAGGGLTCIRVRTHHYIIEWEKGAYTQNSSFSWGWCY